MGNRAVITIASQGPIEESTNLGVYLHWHGSRPDVEAFLAYCEIQRFRTPESDCYGWARLCQVICNYIGGGLSIGIEKCCRLDCDNGDNGVYIIENWRIVGRKFQRGFDEAWDRDIVSALLEIDGKQPKEMQLGKKEIENRIASCGIRKPEGVLQ